MASNDGTLSIDEALQLAKSLHQRRDLEPARTIYERILVAVPEQPDALHFLGLLEYDEGRAGKACALITRAIGAAPDYHDAHINLGNIRKQEGELQEAEACYRQALVLQPDNTAARNNLCVVLGAQGRLEEALVEGQHVVTQNPGVAVYRISLGHVLARLGRNVEAIEQFHTALRVDPNNGHYRGLVVFALAHLGRFDDAAKICEEWQKAEPDNPLPPHHLAALGRREVPARAADAYVRQVFDNFAGSFEAQLRNLGYRAPELIANTLASALGAPTATRAILDAGCGTGLCAPMLRPYAAHLVGVDLSPRMLDRARERGLYDELAEAELTAALAAAPASWDAIVAADVLCYFGDLAEVSAAAAQALRPGGRLVFSVEQASPEDTPLGYRLQVHGRYCHAEPYVQSVLAEVGLTVESIVSDVLRTEGRQPVQGLVVLAQRP